MRRWQGVLGTAAVYLLAVWLSGWQPERGTSAIVALVIGVFLIGAAATFPGYRERGE